MSPPVCVVVGAGTGLGAAIAERFARAGYAVAVCARSREKLEALSADINGKMEQQRAQADCAGSATKAATSQPIPLGYTRAFAMDSTSEQSVADAFRQIRAQMDGPIRVLVYNAAQRKFRTENVLQVSVSTVENFWRVNCLGALLCARQALPDMLAVRPDTGADPLSAAALHKGTILFTGASASLRCLAGMTSMSIGKFGLRALAQGMAREFGAQGIHVAHVVIDGAVDSPLLRSYVAKQLAKKEGSAVLNSPIPAGTPFEARFLQPASVADEFFHLHAQHPSTWTHELDLRPHVEPIMAKL